MNQGPPDFKFSALNYSATPPPLPNAGNEDTDIPLKEPVSYKNTTEEKLAKQMYLKYMFHGQNMEIQPFYVKSDWNPSAQPRKALNGLK